MTNYPNHLLLIILAPHNKLNYASQIIIIIIIIIIIRICWSTLFSMLDWLFHIQQA